MIPKNSRRMWVRASLGMLLCDSLHSLAGSSPDESNLNTRFQGIHGAELVADATFPTNDVIIINTDTGLLFNIGTGRFSSNGKKFSSYGMTQAGDRLAIPKHLRYLHFPENAEFLSLNHPPYFKEPPLVDVTVPVAERIPLEVLDLVRQKNNLLRLKIRLHPKTILIGWDIIEKPKETFLTTKNTYTPPKYSHAGGDFQEATIQNGTIIQKGWYIDPDTGKRIETDF